MLHSVTGNFLCGDSMGSIGQKLPKADVIVTNPPFGTKRGGGGPTRDDFTFETGNKQLNFLQHIYRGLKPGGRAAVVLPDNVLFEEGTGSRIRADLMDKCNLHTILRLPTGIFYAQGVKTNVLFFTRGKTDAGNTKHVWVFDVRANMPSFGKRTPLTREHFVEFEAFYDSRFQVSGNRVQEAAAPQTSPSLKPETCSPETSRFLCFTREQISARGDNLDISWLKDENATAASDLLPPEGIAAMIRERLTTAMEELDVLAAVLEGNDTDE